MRQSNQEWAALVILSGRKSPRALHDKTGCGDLTKRGTQLGGTVADVTRKTTVWYFVLAPLTLLYLAVVFKIATSMRPISGLLGLPTNHLYAIGADIGVFSAPLIAAIFVYVSSLTRRQRHAREAFVRAFEARDLVASKFNPNLIYVVLERGAEGAILKAQAVWTSDGRSTDGTIYENVDAANVTVFDAGRFV
jgi:hypothetical protein